jgi:chaperonin cofactor prefoldin
MMPADQIKQTADRLREMLTQLNKTAEAYQALQMQIDDATEIIEQIGGDEDDEDKYLNQGSLRLATARGITELAHDNFAETVENFIERLDELAQAAT